MTSQETLQSFDELYYATYSSVLKYVVCHCSNIENVRDIVQNIYLDVLKRMKKDPTFLVTKAYVMGICKHKVQDYYRFHYKAKIVSLFSKTIEDSSLADSIPANIDMEDMMIQEEDIKIIWNFLKKKKVIISKIFYLYYYMDFDLKEIAGELHISESNVKNYLYRTLKELQVFLQNRGDKNEK